MRSASGFVRAARAVLVAVGAVVVLTVSAGSASADTWYKSHEYLKDVNKDGTDDSVSTYRSVEDKYLQWTIVIDGKTGEIIVSKIYSTANPNPDTDGSGTSAPTAADLKDAIDKKMLEGGGFGVMLPEVDGIAELEKVSGVGPVKIWNPYDEQGLDDDGISGVPIFVEEEGTGGLGGSFAFDGTGGPLVDQLKDGLESAAGAAGRDSDADDGWEAPDPGDDDLPGPAELVNPKPF